MVTVVGELLLFEKYDREVSIFLPSSELLKEPVTAAQLPPPSTPRLGERLEIVLLLVAFSRCWSALAAQVHTRGPLALTNSAAKEREIFRVRLN